MAAEDCRAALTSDSSPDAGCGRNIESFEKKLHQWFLVCTAIIKVQCHSASRFTNQAGGAAVIADNPAPTACHQHAAFRRPAHCNGPGAGHETDLLCETQGRRQQ